MGDVLTLIAAVVLALIGVTAALWPVRTAYRNLPDEQPPLDGRRAYHTRTEALARATRTEHQ